MNAVTLFLLVILSQNNKPVVVVDRFLTADACEEVRAQLVTGRAAESAGYVRCVRATVARPA